MGKALISFLLALAMLVATPAAADKAQSAAKVHFQKGVKLYKADDYTGAMVEFQKAYEIKPNYTVLYNIAQCHMGLEQYLDALETFEKYLEEGGSEIKKKRQEEVKKHISDLYDILSQVALTVDQDEAWIYIDERAYGMTPHPGIIFLDAGSHVLRIEKDGFETHEQEILLSRGEQLTLQIPMKEIEIEETVPVVQPPPPAAGPTRKKLSPVPFYVLVSATGALAIGFAITGGLAIKKKNEFEDCTREDRDCWKPLKDSHGQLAIAADIFWPTALATLTASVVLAFFTDFKGESRTQATLTPSIAPGRMDLVLRLRF